jgi:hypothetical protein
MYFTLTRVCSIVLLLLTFTTYAQNQNPFEGKQQLAITDSPIAWPKSWNPTCSRPPECARLARKLKRQERYLQAVGNAAKGYQLQPKRRIEKKLDKIFTQDTYDAGVKQFTERRDALAPEIAGYINAGSTKSAYEHFWWHELLFKVNHQIEAIKDNKRSLKLETIEGQLLTELNQKLTKYRTLSADTYLLAGKRLLSLSHRDSLKRAYEYFRISDEYVPNYQNAHDLRREAQKKATISLSISGARYRSASSGIGTAMDEIVRSSINEHGSFGYLPFITLSPDRSGDYVMNMIISEYEVRNNAITSEKKQFKKMVTSGKTPEGQPIKVEKKADMTIKSKVTEASCRVTWEIVSRKDKKVVASGEVFGLYVFETQWAEGSKDKQVIPRKYHALLGKKQEKAPNRSVMLEKCFNDAAEKAAAQAMSRFVIPFGKRVTR